MGNLCALGKSDVEELRAHWSALHALDGTTKRSPEECLTARDMLMNYLLALECNQQRVELGNGVGTLAVRGTWSSDGPIMCSTFYSLAWDSGKSLENGQLHIVVQPRSLSTSVLLWKNHIPRVPSETGTRLFEQAVRWHRRQALLAYVIRMLDRRHARPGWKLFTPELETQTLAFLGF